jgi:hypothetical protein
MIVLAISLLLTLVDRRQLLQARAPPCLPCVGAAANAFIARGALSHRGLRMRGPQCVAKGAARVAMRSVARRCVALQRLAFATAGVALCCVVLQRLALSCVALQRLALRCNGSRCVALRCVALQRLALRCIALQRLALRCVATARDAMRCDALRCRHLRTCTRAAHSLGAKAARPSCSWVLHRIAHSTRALAHTHNLQHTDTHTHRHTQTHTYTHTHTHAHAVSLSLRTRTHAHHAFACSACGVVYDKLLLDVRGLHDVHGGHRPRSVFEAARSDPSHKAHRPPALRGPLLGMRTACEDSGYPL